MRVHLDVGAGRDGDLQYEVTSSTSLSLLAYGYDHDTLTACLEDGRRKLTEKGYTVKTYWQFNETTGDFFCLVDAPE